MSAVRTTCPYCGTGCEMRVGTSRGRVVGGSGSVNGQATGTAKVSIMGSGDVRLTGGAKCTVSKMGSGDVICS